MRLLLLLLRVLALNCTLCKGAGVLRECVAVEGVAVEGVAVATYCPLCLLLLLLLLLLLGVQLLLLQFLMLLLLEQLLLLLRVLALKRILRERIVVAQGRLRETCRPVRAEQASKSTQVRARKMRAQKSAYTRSTCEKSAIKRKIASSGGRQASDKRCKSAMTRIGVCVSRGS